MDDFLIRAFISGLGLAMIAGPFGCLVIWQRMAYFGAALSHAALLGIGLGLLLRINIQVSIIFICILVSLLLLAMYRIKQINTDTALGILAHAMLALGLVVIALMPTTRVDLFAYLFGDILTVGWYDISWIYGGGIFCLLILRIIWRPLLSLTIQTDLAVVDGISKQRTHLIFLLLLSAVIALLIQIVGILLVVSMLIIPAAIAQQFARSPEQMTILASLAGILSVGLGLALSLWIDSPSGPAIVLSSSLIFVLSLIPNLFKKLYH